ncbi:pilus assembly protein [Sulfuriflexus sp.]|uniref:pilus assembly protein n=1 Tax=Sulfuriflexus sp. TaxID=2015443 RepID=UPI0028CE46C6|nr:pilus assembly protein [Sulfuriflexus sp.]MDT8403036.1 pilus assembly protein [Sulfuriflexus sp.]
MVEMAIVISLFLALVFGIIEFSLVIFNWSRVVEATRVGARYAIVNDPACDIYGTSEGVACAGGPLVCDSASTEFNPLEDVNVAGDCEFAEPYTIDNAACSIVEQMRRQQPLIETSVGANVKISYSCSDAGFSGLAQTIPVVKVSTSGVQYRFIVPGILGLDNVAITMPPFETTRTGEDLGTVLPAPP